MIFHDLGIWVSPPATQWRHDLADYVRRRIASVNIKYTQLRLFIRPKALFRYVSRYSVSFVSVAVCDLAVREGAEAGWRESMPIQTRMRLLAVFWVTRRMSWKKVRHWREIWWSGMKCSHAVGLTGSAPPWKSSKNLSHTMVLLSRGIARPSVGPHFVLPRRQCSILPPPCYFCGLSLPFSLCGVLGRLPTPRLAFVMAAVYVRCRLARRQ
jgi:hypothetical protein